MNWGQRIGGTFALLLLITLVACKPAASDESQSEQLSANISGYNHTDDYIHQFYVDEASGPNISAHGGGGKFSCCIVYPSQWKLGMSAKVRWTSSASYPSTDPTETWHEAVVPIDQYKTPGTRLNVHFLPKGEVRLVISSMASGHPDYPGPLPPDGVMWPRQ